jgi:hypothetical protein
MTKHPRRSESPDGDDNGSAVSDAEVEAWAARERQRRVDWSDGPTEEEKKAWARRERWRHDGGGRTKCADVSEGRRVVDRLERDSALALIGAVSLLAEAPYRLVGSLIRAGREWEDELYVPRRQRRRVLLDDED